MFSQFGRSWFRPSRHVRDEDLIRLIEGEAGQRAAERTRRHLRECWDCRTRLRDLEASIAEFARYRPAKRKAEANPPPKGWREFDCRLSSLARQLDESLGAQAPPAPTPRLSLFSLPLKIAAAALLAVAAVIWLPGLQFAVSAEELIRSALAAEAESARNVPQPVVHERFRVQCSSAGAPTLEPSVLELWTDLDGKRTRRQGSTAAWQRLSEILEANVPTERPLMAPGAAAPDRPAAQANQTVHRTKLEDGRRGWLLSTVSPAPRQPGRVFETAMLFDAATWRAVRQTWRIQRPAGIEECELHRDLYEVFPRELLSANIFERTPAAASPPHPDQSVPPAVAAPTVSEAETLRAATLARYALHRLGICRSGSVEVNQTDSGWVEVAGVVSDTNQRRSALAALADIPLLRLELREPPAVALDPPTETGAAPLAQMAAGSEMPAEQLLRRYLSAGEAAGDRNAAVAGFAGRAISLAQEAWNEAWALRRLAAAYPPDQLARLATADAWLVEAMARDHVAEIESLTARLHAQLTPLGPAPGAESGSPGSLPGSESVAGADWRSRAETALENVTLVNDLAHRLFSVSGAEAPAGAEAAETGLRLLLAALATVRGDLRELKQELRTLAVAGTARAKAE